MCVFEFGLNAYSRYNNRTLKRAYDTHSVPHANSWVILFYFIYFLICFYVVAALLSHREVWPEDDCFGSLTAAPEEELMLLRDIFLTNLGPGEFIIYFFLVFFTLARLGMFHIKIKTISRLYIKGAHQCV